MARLTRARGDDYADEFIIVSKKTGQPLNITGYTFLMTLDSLEEPADELTKVYQLVGTITDADNGVVEFVPTEVQTDILGTYYYDIQIIDGAGRKRTVEKGDYVFYQDITK